MTETSYTHSSFSASHKGAFAGEVHGHLWWVEIGWPSEPLVNAEEMHDRLNACLDQWDHKTLDDVFEPTNEGVNRAVRNQIAGLIEVSVWRDGRVPSRARWINKSNERGRPEASAQQEGGCEDRKTGANHA